jgi:hypothetical protein
MEQIHEYILGAGILLISVVFIIKWMMRECRSHECAFCGRKISAEESAHHAEVCALKSMLRRELSGNDHAPISVLSNDRDQP